MSDKDDWGKYDSAWNGIRQSIDDYQVLNLETKDKIHIFDFIYHSGLREVFNIYDRDELRKPTKEYTKYYDEHPYMGLTTHELVIFNFINKVLADKNYRFFNEETGRFMTHLPIDYFVYGVY